MAFAKVYSAQTFLLTPHLISVETDLSKGLHAFTIVGLPDKAVEEARDRVGAAIKNAGYKSPKNRNKKTVVSLAPADLKKEGPLFDLAIALSFLLASRDISFNPEGKIFLGELSLDGALRPVRGVLPLARFAKEQGFTELYVPKENAAEAALIEGLAVYAVSSLKEIIAHLTDEEERLLRQPPTIFEARTGDFDVDLDDVRGQEVGKRGLLIAAAGKHNLALFGPPGTGKSMLAKALRSILPALSFDEALEVTSVHSVAGTLEGSLLTAPPFRAPHHTSSHAALVGGGSSPRPGEITLAHKGVLFLDEFPEFDRRVVEALRQPLEDRVIAISRVKGSATFPADFILVAALNPCPCGNFGSEKKECVCLPSHLLRYQRKISGPLMDRIDMWIEVPEIAHERLSARRARSGESAEAREKILAARKIQEERFKDHPRGVRTNAAMSVRDLEETISLPKDIVAALNAAAARMLLSPRAYHKTLKLARTIADLEGAQKIKMPHVLEALSYRPKVNR